MIWVVFCPTIMVAQSDFGSSLSGEVEKKLDKKLTVGMQLELRMRDNSTEVDRLSAGLNADYKCLPWLKASAGVSFLGDNVRRISHYDENDRDVLKGKAMVGDRKNLREYWGARLRGDLSLTATRQFGHFRFSLRERWQYTYRFRRYVEGRYNYVYKKSDIAYRIYPAKGKNELRSRLMVSYRNSALALEPYLGAEIFNTREIEKVRYTIGFSYKIHKGRTIDVFYRYQDMTDESDDHPDVHLIGVAYKMKF